MFTSKLPKREITSASAPDRSPIAMRSSVLPVLPGVPTSRLSATDRDYAVEAERSDFDRHDGHQ
jgi:hypothetical protein